MNKTIKECLDIVTKLEKKTNICEFFSSKPKYERYVQIAELYEKIGNQYRINDSTNAIMYLTKAYNYYLLVDKEFDFYNYKIKELALLLAELQLASNYEESIKLYNKVINFYINSGDLVNIIKYYYVIAMVYVKNNCENKAIEYLNKILVYKSEVSTYILQAKEKLAELFVNQNKYLEASKLYYDLGTNNKLSKNKLNNIQNNYCFLYLLCIYASGDIILCEKKCEELEKSVMNFDSYNIKRVIDSPDDLDYIIDECKNCKISNKLLLEIQTNNLFGNDIDLA